MKTFYERMIDKNPGLEDSYHTSVMLTKCAWHDEDSLTERQFLAVSWITRRIFMPIVRCLLKAGLR